MKVFAYFILILVMPLALAAQCQVISIKTGEHCTYGGDGSTEGVPVKEVTDSLGDVYKVGVVEIGAETGRDDLEFCGVSRQAKPKQVGDKYFFTFNGVDLEAEAVGQSIWDLVTTRIEYR